MPKKLFINAESLSDKEKEEEKKRKNSHQLDGEERGPIEEVNRWLAKNSSLKLKDKVIFYRLFAAMINAGISITKALEILKEQVESLKLKIISEDILKRVEGGQSLSDSLEEYPKDFSEVEIGMVRSGEASGKLNVSLLNLADQMEKSSSLTKKLRGAMIYPIVIFIVLIVALFAVMTLVIPQIKEMFESFNTELPMMTQMLIDFSDFMIERGGLFDLPNVFNIIIYFVLFILTINYLRKTKQGKYWWDLFLLKIPIFGSLTQKVALSKMCRGIGTLTASGLSIIKTLQISSEMIGNEVYRLRILRIANDVKIGINMADNMRGDSLFPPIVTSMIGVGTQTAQLDKVTIKLAEFFEDDVDGVVKNLSSILEPIIIVVVGLSVGGLVVAIMLPILSLSDLAGNQ